MTARPNILLITADQWRGEALGAMGHPVRTPALDRLAAGGTLFARHYAACAPCSPARASLYTGLYQMTHRVIWNGAGLDARFDNVALAARRAGYRPTLFGYTDTAPDPRRCAPGDPALRSYEGVLPGFEVRQALPEDDAPWLSWLRRRGHAVDPARIHHVPAELGARVSRAAPVYGADETQTAFLTGAFLDWLGEQTAGVPWFAHISYLRPHPPFVVPAPYNTMYDAARLPSPRGAARPEDAAALHPFVALQQPEARLADFLPGANGLVRDLSAGDLARLRALYFGMISEVDAQIGRLLDGLAAAGQEGRTVVLVTSDHGEMLGDHWMLGKAGPFEQSFHIPAILRTPEGAAAGRVDAFTSAVDVFPTLCDLMAVAPAHAPQGRSLLPLAAGAPGHRAAALWEYDFRHAIPAAALARAGLAPADCVLLSRRSDTALFVQSPAFPPALFDPARDPDATRDLARAPEAQRRLTAEALALLDDRARLADQTLAGRLVWEWHRGA